MRVYIFDLLRFIASLLIVFFHYFFVNPHVDFPIFIKNICKYFYLGINFFFILSGFVIALSIKNKSSLNFLKSRIRRLYPIYWISIIFTSFVILFFGGPDYKIYLKQFFYNLTMFQNYFKIPSIDGVYWTLFVELKFYIFIIMPFLILRKFIKIKLDFLILFWLLMTILNIFNINIYIFSLFKNYFLLDWSSYFISGIIFYNIFKGESSMKNYLFLIICFLISLHHSIANIQYLELRFNVEFNPIIIFLINMFFYLLLFSISSRPKQIPNYSGFKILGLISYPLYLVHQNFGYIIFKILADDFNIFALSILIIIFVMCISYLISFLDSRLLSFKKPFKNPFEEN